MNLDFDGRVVLVLSLAIVGCGRPTAAPEAERSSSTPNTGQLPSTPPDPQKSASETPSTTPKPATAATREQVASMWIDGLSKKDVEAMRAVTALPFSVHDPASTTECQNRTANDAQELTEALECITGNKLLVEDLAFPFNKPHTASRIAQSELPNWARRWRTEILPGVQPMQFDLLGAGVMHEMILLVGTDGVHAFWREASYDAR